MNDSNYAAFAINTAGVFSLSVQSYVRRNNNLSAADRSPLPGGNYLITAKFVIYSSADDGLCRNVIKRNVRFVSNSAEIRDYTNVTGTLLGQ